MDQNHVMGCAMRIARRRVTGRYVHTQTTVDIAVIICAGTYAPPIPAAAMAPPCGGPVLSSVAHHMTITAASMDWIGGVMLLILAAQAAHLQTKMRSVLTVIRGRGAKKGVTTPSNTADTLEMIPTITVLMVAVFQ